MSATSVLHSCFLLLLSGEGWTPRRASCGSVTHEANNSDSDQRLPHYLRLLLSRADSSRRYAARRSDVRTMARAMLSQARMQTLY